MPERSCEASNLVDCAYRTSTDHLAEPYPKRHSGVRFKKKALNAPVNHYNFLSASYVSERSQLMEQYQITSLSVNQPWGRNHALVCVGPGGIRNHEASPTAKVKQPSIRNKYRHPLRPPTPRRRNIPVARKALTISVI